MKTVSELLFEAARRNPPSDSVPDGFEHRFMAFLKQRQNRLQDHRLMPDVPVDAWWIWTRTFLRAAWSGALVAGFLAIGSLMMAPQAMDDLNDLGAITDAGNPAMDEAGGEIL